MFFKKESKELSQEIFRLKRELLDKQIELDRVIERKKTEEQELKHMIRMKEERNELELEKAKQKIRTETDAEIAKVKDEYRDKLEKRLLEETKTIKSMYSEILARLPNISAKLSGGI